MKKIPLIFAVVVALSLALPFSGGAEQKLDAQVIINQAKTVLDELKLKDYWHYPENYIKTCAGVAIIPGMVEGGFVLGAAYGKGVLLSRKEGNWAGPAFIYTASGSLGLQIGVQSVDLILIVMGQKTMDSFLKSKFKLGADVAAAAGPVGAQASAATEIMLKGGIFTYAMSKGLFAGVSLEGAYLGSHYDLNRAYYETTSSPEEILSGQMTPPSSAQPLIAELEKIK
jgi:lipid-binding SYLF domain-containing protein